MAKVLTNGEIKIGAYRFPDRKRIAICVEEGNRINICGYFTSADNANFLMDKLGELVGAVKEGADNG